MEAIVKLSSKYKSLHHPDSPLEQQLRCCTHCASVLWESSSALPAYDKRCSAGSSPPLSCARTQTVHALMRLSWSAGAWSRELARSPRYLSAASLAPLHSISLLRMHHTASPSAPAAAPPRAYRRARAPGRARRYACRWRRPQPPHTRDPHAACRRRRRSRRQACTRCEAVEVTSHGCWEQGSMHSSGHAVRAFI